MTTPTTTAQPPSEPVTTPPATPPAATPPAVPAAPVAAAPVVPPATPATPSTPPAVPPPTLDSYALTVPDEAKRFAPDKTLARIKAIAVEEQWTNEQAQAALDAHLANASEDFLAQTAAWEAETRADSEWGGAKLAETQKLAQRGIDAVLPEGHPLRDRFLETVNGSGSGLRLEVLAFLATIGHKVSEDTLGTTRSSVAREGDRESKFYDHPTSRAATPA